MRGKKAGGKSVNARKRRTATGSVAANLHEGSRSEYLAQYVFAALGTASPVPHQEDHGIDLYCTLMERERGGKRSWPRAHYTVQVKSSDDDLLFEGGESVKWLLNHPLPLFLCVVNKKRARLQIFTTHARFSASFPSHPPESVRLRPGPAKASTKLVQGRTRWDVSLGPPILDSTIADLLRDETRNAWWHVLRAWAEVDDHALLRRRQGILSVTTPQYETNLAPSETTSATTSAGLGPGALAALSEHIEDVAAARAATELDVTDVLLCALHRKISDMSRQGGAMMFSHLRLNALLGVERPLAGADCVIALVRELLKPRQK